MVDGSPERPGVGVRDVLSDDCTGVSSGLSLGVWSVMGRLSFVAACCAKP
jgi:hypothetical protein